MSCKIYLLTNKINNKIYIGQTWLELADRMGREGGLYSNSPYLYAAIQKHGYLNFEYTVLATTEDQAEADRLEAEFIVQYNSKDNTVGYNLKDGGRGGRHSEKSKAKISASLKAKVWSDEALEAKSKTGKAWLGRKRGPHTEERKKEISEHSKEWHANNTHPMLGKEHTSEAKEKMGEASKKAWKNESRHTPEAKEKRAKAQMVSKEREVGILETYKEDKLTIEEIVTKFNTGKATIYRILNRNNVPRREVNTKPRKAHTEKAKEKMSLYKTKYWENKNQKEIGALSADEKESVEGTDSDK